MLRAGFTAQGSGFRSEIQIFWAELLSVVALLPNEILLVWRPASIECPSMQETQALGRLEVVRIVGSEGVLQCLSLAGFPEVFGRVSERNSSRIIMECAAEIC